MVPDHFIDHEPDELLAKIRIKLGFLRQFAQPGDLAFFAQRITGRKRVLRLVCPHRLGDAKPLSEHVDQRRIDVVNRGAEAGEHGVWNWIGHRMPR